MGLRKDADWHTLRVSEKERGAHRMAQSVDTQSSQESKRAKERRARGEMAEKGASAEMTSPGAKCGYRSRASREGSTMGALLPNRCENFTSPRKRDPDSRVAYARQCQRKAHRCGDARDGEEQGSKDFRHPAGLHFPPKCWVGGLFLPVRRANYGLQRIFAKNSPRDAAESRAHGHLPHAPSE